MSEPISLNLNLGSNLNNHSIIVNIEGDEVTFRKRESVYLYEERSYYKLLGIADREEARRFCRELLKALI
jgi:hypothetical protein